MAIIVRRHPRTESKQHRTGRPKLSLTLNSRQHVYLHIYVARVCLWRLYRMLAMRMRYEKRGICFTECDSAVEEARPLELTRMRHFQAAAEKKERERERVLCFQTSFFQKLRWIYLRAIAGSVILWLLRARYSVKVRPQPLDFL